MKDQKQLQIYLLGSPRLLWEKETLTISRRQVRALLYRLAASLEPVTREELYALLWPEKPDTTARRNLSRLMAYLRQELPDPDLVRATPETVTLDTAGVWCDFPVFLSIDNTSSDEILEEAASLIEGRFLEGFYLPDNLLFDDWLLETQRQVEQKHQRILDELVARKTSVKDYEHAIEYARQSLAIDNLDEARHRQLIELHVANGDRRAAQRQYEECVTILEKELGVSPLPQTRATFEAALQEQSAPQPAYPAPRWAILPSLDLPLIGREAVWRQLEQAQQRMQSGGMIWISGEAGIGKSRLMQEFASQGPTLVLTGNAHAGTQAIPFAPLIAALRPAVEHPDWLVQVPKSWLSEAQVLLPELRTAFPRLPFPLPLEPNQVQGRHFEALTQIFLGLSSKQTPLWLCLDDLHWADEDTLAWLGYFITRLPDSDVIVIATSRISESPNLETYLAQMRRSNQFAEISLETLGARAIGQLLLNLPEPIRSPELTQRLLRTTGGNPFFLLEILHTLMESGEINQSPESLPLPPSVREVITTRLRLINPLAMQILEAAAILETNLQPEILKAVSGRQEDEITQGLMELTDHQLLRADEKSLSFQHDLLRMTILDGLHFWRKQALHRRAARILSEISSIHPTRIAHHWEQAEAWAEAATAYGQACQYLADQYAYQAALAQVQRGLDLLKYLSDAQQVRLDLLLLRMQLYQVLLQLPEWRADLEMAEDLAIVLSDENARLQVFESQLSLLTLQSNLPDLEIIAQKALDLAKKRNNQLAEARIHHIWGWHLSDVGGRPFDGQPHLEKAVKLAQKEGNQVLLYRSMCNLAFSQRAQGCCGDALNSARQALALIPATNGPHPAQADALREMAEAAGYLARWQEARAAMLQVVRLYEEIGDPWALGTAIYNLGLFTSAMGQHGEAITAMERLVQLGLDVGLPPDSEYGIIHRSGLAKALLDGGDLASASELYQSLRIPDHISGRARIDYANVGSGIALASGDAAAALIILEPVVNELQSSRVAHFMWTLLQHARAAHQVGETQKALNSLKQAEAVLQQGDCIRLIRLLNFEKYQVTGDPKALEAAHQEMQRQANLFTDTRLRRDFLEKVLLNHQITVAWQQSG